MGRGRRRGQRGGGKGEIGRDGEGEKKGQGEGRFHRWIRWDAWVDIGYRFIIAASR